MRPRLLAALLVLLGCSDLGSDSASGSDPESVVAEALPDGVVSVNGIVFDPLPGAEAPDELLHQRLAARLAAKPDDWRPRTRHVREDGSPKYTNRLGLESSPYLQQHAHNPVDWHPWGDEAFEKAKRLGRPVFLSIGYSTCHWCHVMEEESFEDEEIAAALNSKYVAIKVDREERPDVDSVYMSAVQALTGRGGWPMSVWLAPDRRPFYGGTYFAARDGDRGARTGFLTLVHALRGHYDEDPERIAQAGAQLAERIRMMSEPPAPTGADVDVEAAAEQATRSYRTSFDPVNGGLGTRGNKFPSSLPIRWLLRRHARSGEASLLEMADLTMRKMAEGGMYDHVGGGFHRYSVDPVWLVPHFEKMLYDQALLVPVYLEGFQATGNERFAAVAQDVLAYVKREMTAPAGGFYSATDADSVTPSGLREEGWFFTWTPTELEAVLGSEAARVVGTHYAVTPTGNFEGRSILHLTRDVADTAGLLGMPVEAVARTLESSREKLYAVRSERPAPLRDDKILAGWNGLMISAFAQAALVLDEPDHAASANAAADFILGTMRREDGRLFRSWNAGVFGAQGVLDDYAFFIAGLLDLYEATGDVGRLRAAVELDEVLRTAFEDLEAGGYYRTPSDGEVLLVREKPSQDGARPTGTSIQMLNLLRLAEFTTDDAYRRRADATVAALSGMFKRAPRALSDGMLALDFRQGRVREIVVVAPPGTAAYSEAKPLLDVLRRTFVPNRILAVASEGPELEALAAVVPLAAGKTARGGRVTAYVCERGTCKLPTSDPDVLARQLIE